MATNLTRFEPYSSLARLNPLRAFDELFRDLTPRGGAMRELEMEPIPIDVRETDQAYTVRAEIPGAKKEDIKVDVSGSRVAITAEIRREEDQQQGGRVLRREMFFGQMQRIFTLDHDIDDSKAQAKYENGVLELNLPKKAAGAGAKLQIQ